jgi:hypothetical protein
VIKKGYYMKRLVTIFLSILSLQTSFAQTTEKFRNGERFNSVFQSYEQGEFKGTTNGVLFIVKPNGKELILDFQGSDGKLLIEKDQDEVYDVSTKSYYGKTTSGKTEIKYETYAWANGISIKLNEQWFEITAIDGACDMVINGIEYSYKAESSAEYLVLKVQKELELNNWQFLLRTEHTLNSDNLEELKPKKKVLKILPNSTLVFAIKRTLTNPAIQSIEKVFDNYIKYQESTDSPDNKESMLKSLESLNSIKSQNDLEVLINVWLYYDPTDFPTRGLVYSVLDESKPESIIAVKKRMGSKKEWEREDAAPYSELNYLLTELEKE